MGILHSGTHPTASQRTVSGFVHSADTDGYDQGAKSGSCSEMSLAVPDLTFGRCDPL